MFWFSVGILVKQCCFDGSRIIKGGSVQIQQEIVVQELCKQVEYHNICIRSFTIIFPLQMRSHPVTSARYSHSISANSSQIQLHFQDPWNLLGCFWARKAVFSFRCKREGEIPSPLWESAEIEEGSSGSLQLLLRQLKFPHSDELILILT